MNTLSIIIPAFNEENTIAEIIRRVKTVPLKGIKKEIIVIDDHSSDKTYPVLKSLKSKYSIKLYRQPKNFGKGAAIRTGLKHATGEIILFQDADLEYETSEYPELLKPILKGKTDFVMGSRHLNTNRWKARKFLDSKIYAGILNFGSVFYSQLVNWVYQVNYTDPGTMYKIFRKKCLDGITLKSNHFDIDWELVGKFSKRGIKAYEVPITYKSRSPKEGKKIKFLRDGYLILSAIIRYRFMD